MLTDDLRGMWAITLKDLRAYYFKPPNISWGIIFPFAFVLAFLVREGVRNLSDLADLVPGLLGLTLMFGTTSTEAIVITFERRIGALERLLLAPLRLPALLAGKVLGGMVFGLMTTAVVAALALLLFGTTGVHWPLLIATLLVAAAAFCALGAWISVSVKEVFEAQTLANAVRFPMMFLGGVFVPLEAMPGWLRVVARALPLTYAVEALRAALGQGSVRRALVDLGVLVAFTTIFSVLTARMMEKWVG
jgi:ABC-2 type transport system permease protein